MSSDLWLTFDQLSYLDLAYICCNLAPQDGTQPIPYAVWKRVEDVFAYFGIYAAYRGHEPVDWQQVAKIKALHPHQAREFAVSKGIRPPLLIS